MDPSESIRRRRRRRPLVTSHFHADASEPVVCTLFERCKGCPYPGHGFICWSKDGSCLKTVMDKIYEKKEDKK